MVECSTKLFVVSLRLNRVNMVQTFIQTILQTQSIYRQIIHRKIREHNIDITFEMLHILICLGRSGQVNQQELANLTYKDKSSLSYLIKNMEKRGLVQRVEDVNDKRSKLVRMTDRGMELQARIRTIIDDVYEQVEGKVNIDHVQLCIDYMREFSETIKED